MAPDGRTWTNLSPSAFGPPSAGDKKPTATCIAAKKKAFPHPSLPFARVSPLLSSSKGWSGGAMVLGKLSVPGRPTILIIVGQGPIALAVGAGGGGLDIFTLIYPFSSFSLSLGNGPI